MFPPTSSLTTLETRAAEDENIRVYTDYWAPWSAMKEVVR